MYVLFLRERERERERERDLLLSNFKKICLKRKKSRFEMQISPSSIALVGTLRVPLETASN